MSHYEERLERDVKRIRTRLARMGEAVLKAVNSATKSVIERDSGLAAETILGDMPINRQSRKLEHRCHLFVARHLPSAGHLRFITGMLRLNRTLERIGDYAQTISRESYQIEGKVPPKVLQDIQLLHGKATNLLESSISSFVEEDVEQARATLAKASQFGTTYDKVFADLTAAGEKGETSIQSLFALWAGCNRLERTIHQAKNIGQQTIFMATGMQKEEKTFNILFLGKDNDGPSLLAEHYCRKAYPDAGTVSSAGWESGGIIADEFLAFCESKNLDLRDADPSQYTAIQEQLSDFDIIIDLTGIASENIRKVPFHTTLLVWTIDKSQGPEAVYQDLVMRIGDLMEILRGEEAED